MGSSFFLSIAVNATWDLIKTSGKFVKNALKEKLSKWFADDVISEIYNSIEKAPPFYLDSKDKIEAYLGMNSTLMSYFDRMSGGINTYNQIQQKAQNVSGIIAGVITGSVTQYTNTEKPRRVTGEPFSIIQDYLRFRSIQIVKSYSSIRDKPEIGATENGKLFVSSKFVLPMQETTPHSFVMILFSYIPPENWTEFASKGCQIEFEVNVSPEIEAIQLQIKDSKQKQFVDIALTAANGRILFRKKLIELAPVDAWKDTGEICFTIFSEKSSICGQPLYCKIGCFNLV